MGADLIAYTVLIPDANGVELMHDRLKQLEYVELPKLLKEGPGNWKALLDRWVCIDQYEEDFYCELNNMEAEDEVAYITELFRLVMDDINLLNEVQTFDDFIGRDASYITIVGHDGTTVNIVTAGDMSWGDTPDGTSYKLLAAAVRLKIDLVWLHSIPFLMQGE